MDNNEKKKKIKMLEEEIELMQKDHAETFGYKLPKKIKLTPADGIIFIVGIMLIVTGLVWAACNISFLNGLALFSTGGVRFFKSLYSLPLIIGIASLILCKRKRIPALITAVGFALSLWKTFSVIDFSQNSPLAVIMTIAVIIGTVMVCFPAVKFFLKTSEDKD